MIRKKFMKIKNAYILLGDDFFAVTNLMLKKNHRINSTKPFNGGSAIYCIVVQHGNTTH